MPIPNSVNPIPNAFKNSGAMTGNVPLTSTAAAVANPMLNYWLQLPQSYYTIIIENEALWKVQNNLVKTTPYGAGTGKTWQVNKYKLAPPGKGLLNGYASLGNEYKQANLWGWINTLPGDHTSVLRRLLQRTKEMSPGYTMAQLKALFQSCPIPHNAVKMTVYIYENDVCSGTPGVQGFFMFDDGDDSTQNQTQGQPPPFIIPNTEQSEGEEKKIFSETPTHNEPNTCWSNIAGPYPTDKHFTDETGTFYWRPGTGFKQSLGTLRIYRETVITFTGMP